LVEIELYDLAHDPYELDNLAGLASHRELADSLRERLLARLVAAGEAAPVIDPAPVRTHPQRRIDPTARSFDLDGVRFGHQPRS
jgi:hypothetical protein